MQYISLGNSEYFSISPGVFVPSKEEENWGDAVAYVVPGDFASGQEVAYVYQTKRMLSQIGVAKAKNKISPIGTVLLQRSGPRVPRIGILKVPSVTSHYFFGITINDQKPLIPDYVARMLNSAKDQISYFSVGSVMKNLRRDTLLSIQIPMVPFEEQTTILGQR